MAYEQERLHTLQSLKLLDTAPSESFDRITRMASQLFGLPVSAVSLTDSDRQWFKSRVGVDHFEIPRHLAPCAEVADTRATVVLRDMATDPKYRESHLAQNGVRFYAGAPLTTRDGYTLGAMCVLGTEPRDITQLELDALSDMASMVMDQIELQHAFGRVDANTLLSNRNQLIEDIADAALDSPGAKRTCAYISVLPIEQISDTLRVVGQTFFDDMARNAARRLQQALPEVKFYNLYGCDFAFVLHGSDENELLQLSDKLRQVLVEEKSDSASQMFRPAIGMAHFLLGQSDPDDVLRFARSASQDARDQNKLVAAFSDYSDEAHHRRFTLLNDLPIALKSDDQLKLVYQPRVSFETGACIGAEALIRWTHPRLGPISPAEFIPLAESVGLARPVTDWVLRAALAQIADWQSLNLELTVSINISVLNLEEDGFADRVLSEMLIAGVHANSVELEITETGLLKNGDERAFSELTALRAAGLRVAVDDFGTGYSSLSHLKRMPADVIKIDQSFIRELKSSGRDLELVKSMIGMIHQLGFKVVAEGVETGEAYDALEESGCDEAQGYFLAKPLSSSGLEDWISLKTQTLQLAS